jgi:DNA-binding XRE family transcriptional regulator
MNLIYALYCPINNIPVYVGQSSVGMNRPFDHIKEKSHSIKINSWVKSLNSINYQPIVIVLESEFKDEYLNSKEHYWIQKYLNDGHILMNQQNVSPAFYFTKEFDSNVDNDPLIEIRLFIKAKRKLNKLTQKELASLSGVGLAVIRKIEQGKSNIHIHVLLQIIKLFGTFKLTLDRVNQY